MANLNLVAHTLMDSQGRLGSDRLRVDGCEFAPGDRIVCGRNSDQRGVRNGTRGTIETIDQERSALRVRTDRGELVTLNQRYLTSGHVRHAYALTGHAGQGASVEHAFVLGRNEARLQEWGYVALSRARQATRLYLTSSQRDIDGEPARRDSSDAASRYAAALEQSAEERLAIETTRPAPQTHHEAPRIARHPSSNERRAEFLTVEQQRRTIKAGLKQGAITGATAQAQLHHLDARAAELRPCRQYDRPTRSLR